MSKTITGSKNTRYNMACITVSELTKLLSKVPPDTPVLFEWEGQLQPGYIDINIPEINTTKFSEPVLILNAE